MKRLLIFLWKLATTIVSFGLAVIALRRILIDVEDVIQNAKSIFSSDEVPHSEPADSKREPDELTRPLERGGLPLGLRTDWKTWMSVSQRNLSLSSRSREERPNIMVTGSPGTGKTRYLANLIKADIESGNRAVVVIDSDGDLVDLLQQWMVAHSSRVELSGRIVILDPTDPSTATYNPLKGNSSGHQELATALMHTMTTMYTVPQGPQSPWNAQTANIFRDGILLLLANDKSLSDFHFLVTDNDFRDTLMDDLSIKAKAASHYTALLDSWNRYKKLARTDQWIVWVEPILTRLDRLLSDPRVRSILLAESNSLSLDDVISHKRIVLVKLERRKLDTSASFLGAMIALALSDAANSRNRGGEKVTSVLYLNNLDKGLGAETFSAITDDAKTEGSRVEVIGAVQALSALPELFRHHLIAKCGTLVSFAVSKADATFLTPYFFRSDGSRSPESVAREHVTVERLMKLPARELYCYRTGTAAGAFRLRSNDFGTIEKGN